MKGESGGGLREDGRERAAGRCGQGRGLRCPEGWRGAGAFLRGSSRGSGTPAAVAPLWVSAARGGERWLRGVGRTEPRLGPAAPGGPGGACRAVRAGPPRPRGIRRARVSRCPEKGLRSGGSELLAGFSEERRTASPSALVFGSSHLILLTQTHG